MKRFVHCMMAALILAGCSQNDVQYYRSGIGTELSYARLPAQTRILEDYVQLICQQAGSSSCDMDWNLFVQAGMNDIDQRCDAYLAWLDDRRRSNDTIMGQINVTEGTTQTILLAAQASSLAIGVVGAAFGFARNTFNNINSRLLTEVNHSTVQAIVLTTQTRFRTELQNHAIGSRPNAIYALRQYLRICMPFTIETEINNTLTTLATGGPRALEVQGRIPLIATETIGASAPVLPRQVVVERKYIVQPPEPLYGTILVESVGPFSESYVANVLDNICVPAEEIVKVDKKTSARIKAYQQYLKLRGGEPETEITGKLTARELQLANESTGCASESYSNFYERQTFPRGINTSDVIDLLNVALPDGNKIATNATIGEVRSRIAEVRKAVDADLTMRDADLSDQLTFDLVLALGRRAEP
jgi:hypothetical protein